MDAVRRAAAAVAAACSGSSRESRDPAADNRDHHDQEILKININCHIARKRRGVCKLQQSVMSIRGLKKTHKKTERVRQL